MTNIPEFLNSETLEKVLIDFVSKYGFSVGKLSFNFVSKERLLKINKQFLNHDTHTDIISFDYSKKSVLEAEFFISMWAVRLSAKEESQSIVNETLRVISHGVLHCIGLKDKNDTEKSKMRIKEKEFIDLFHVKHKSNV